MKEGVSVYLFGSAFTISSNPPPPRVQGDRPTTTMRWVVVHEMIALEAKSENEIWNETWNEIWKQTWSTFMYQRRVSNLLQDRHRYHCHCRHPCSLRESESEFHEWGQLYYLCYIITSRTGGVSEPTRLMIRINTRIYPNPWDGPLESFCHGCEYSKEGYRVRVIGWEWVGATHNGQMVNTFICRQM